MESEDADIVVIDDLLPPDFHRELWLDLVLSGWNFGSAASTASDAEQYFYKHFGGVQRHGRERHQSVAETEIVKFPIIARVWQEYVREYMPGQKLLSCYANGMQCGIEPDVHSDSNVPGFLSAIYYPHLTWNPEDAGETIFFNDDKTDIIAAIYPKPNRLVVFPATAPHVARPMSRRRKGLRVTLMFKCMTDAYDNRETD